MVKNEKLGSKNFNLTHNCILVENSPNYNPVTMAEIFARAFVKISGDESLDPSSI